jgi:hypothetical protein
MLRFADDIAIIAENEELQKMLRYMEETLLNEPQHENKYEKD